MTVKLLLDYRIDGQDYKTGNLVTTSAGTEAGLISSKMASSDLTGGTVYVAPVAQVQFTPVTATTNHVTGGIRISLEGGSVPVVQTQQRVIVILGSSNGAGAGCSDYVADPSSASGYASPAKSWAGLLQAQLGVGYKVINRSISGTGTVSAVARFWTDVAPHNPDFVIICPHVQNDTYDYPTIAKNTQLLCSFCDRIGAVPVIRGAYVSNTMTASQYRSMLALNRALDSLGRYRIDHMGVFDDGSGHFAATGFDTGDGLHPNDLGYEQLFRAIDIGIFSAGAGAFRPMVQKGTAAWLPSGSAGPIYGPGILLQNLQLGLRSWTMRARIKCTNTSAANLRAFMTAYRPAGGAASAFRLRNPANVYELVERGGSLVTSGVLTNVVAWHDIVMGYSRVKNKIILFVDNVLIGETASADTDVEGLFTGFTYFARGDTGDSGAFYFAFADMGLWNIPPTAEFVGELAAGRIPHAGLIYYNTASGNPAGVTTTDALVNDAGGPVYGVGPAFGVTRVINP